MTKTLRSVASRFASNRVTRCALLLAATTLGACGGADGSVADAERVDTTQDPLLIIDPFSMDSYETSLKSALNAAGGMGYTYAIYQKGSLKRAGASGWAVKGIVPWTPDMPYSMMSMGKTITAAAYASLLAQTNGAITLDTPIKPYLPMGWTKDPDIDSVTFRLLFAHQSGIINGVDSWNDIKNQVDDNVIAANTLLWNWKPAGVGTYWYSNTNFTLGRVMLGYVAEPGVAALNELNGNGPTYTAYKYRSWVLNNIFAPLGLGTNQVDVQPIGLQPGTYNQDGSQAYYEPTDGASILDAGAGYWTLSVKSYAKFLDALQAGSFNGAWTEMTKGVNGTNVGLGLFRISGKKGTYFTHDGFWHNDGMGVGKCGRWMTYPNGMSVVWSMNSGKKDADGNVYCPVTGHQNMMRDAYDNAWIL